MTVTVTREVIHVDTVLGDHRKADDSWDFMLDPEKRIGYIRVTTFSRDTADDLKKAIRRFESPQNERADPRPAIQSGRAVDLGHRDLRHVSDQGTDRQHGRPQHAQASLGCHREGDALEGFPIAMLVNRYSASASEIVSACLQDHKRAVIVGERTWGKGSVQNVIELEDGKSLLKLTTASYQRPSGKNIHRFPDSKETDEWGVSPNPGYAVKLSDAEMAEILADRRERDIVAGKSADAKPDTKPGSTGQDSKTANETAAKRHVSDKQLQKAIDYLNSEMAKAQ